MTDPSSKSPATDFATFGEILKYARRQAHLTQDELAGAVGYSREQITKLENNKRAPDPVSVKALFLHALDLHSDSQLAVRMLELARRARDIPSGVQGAPIPRTNLSVPLTSFIGREREISEVKQLLSSARLLTLTGTGGVGKTRLAIRIGLDSLPVFEGGVWMVELGSLNDPALLAGRIANVFDLPADQRRTEEDVLADHLRELHALLILDNCEQLLVACAKIAESLLRAAPQLQIIATSRESLGILSATTYRVPSLTLPDTRPSAIPLDETEAVRLFVDRAGSAKPDFRLSPANASSVSEICRRLDGVPLAIELAATRVRVMSVQAIAEQLQDRFRFLTNGEVTALPRHRTLRAMIDWSYDLLMDAERALFRQFAVFAGGFGLDTVEDLGGREAVDGLMALVEKSLFWVEEQDHASRYRQLESLREYGLEKLSAEHELEEARRRHLSYFVTFVERNNSKLRGPVQKTWYERFDLEHDNFRKALDWAVLSKDADMGLRLIAPLWFFWFWRGHWAEGTRWCEAILELPVEMDARLRARALIGASNLPGRLGDYATSGQWLAEGTRLAEQVGDAEALAWARLDATFGIRDDLQANALLAQALEYARTAGDDWFCAEILHVGGERARGRGELMRAQELFNESEKLFRATGDQERATKLIGNLGLLSYERGDYISAAAAYRECLDGARARNDKLEAANWLLAIARLALKQAEPARVIEALAEGLPIFLEVSDQEAIADGLVISADLANLSKQRVRAALILGAADKILERFNLMHEVMSPDMYAEFRRVVDAAQGHGGKAAFQSAWERGRGLPLEDAVAIATENTGADSPELLKAGWHPQT